MPNPAYRVNWGKPSKIMPEISVPASKSELNRLLVLAALRSGESEIVRKNSCDDVAGMIAALRDFGIGVNETAEGYRISNCGLERLAKNREKRTIECGSGGTTFRFLMAVAAALPYTTELRASPQMLGRPSGEWIETLTKIGAQVTKTDGGFLIRGISPWPSRIVIAADRSSQFASALALVCSAQKKETEIILEGTLVSEPYWKMTLACLETARNRVTELPRSVVIAPVSSDKNHSSFTFEAEGDASSAAVWLAAGALGKSVRVSNYPRTTRQADVRFCEILSQFNSEVKKEEAGTFASPAKPTDKTRTIDLKESPDLAPVLSVMSALLPGMTRIVGAEHLRYKESNRIEDLIEAFSAVGISMSGTKDGLEIPGSQIPKEGSVDPHGDHRLAMAAMLLASRASSVTITHGDVVSKSYREFWKDVKHVGWLIEEVSVKEKA